MNSNSVVFIAFEERENLGIGYLYAVLSGAGYEVRIINARKDKSKILKELLELNPMLVGDGKEPFIAYFEKMAIEYPDKSIEFVRSVAEGDLVALHTHQTWPGNDEYVTMDFFRFDEAGKIVEHWDSMQQIPEKSENGNTMY